MRFKEIYIYGEVLFDCFENGEDKLGGAPFNVAWNLKGFGLNPKMITSIGEDDLGVKVLDYMKKWDMDTSFVNELDDKKTGSVTVKLDKKGVPTYSIEDDCAYDYINTPNNLEKDSIFYHGSLALRNSFNQNVSNELKETTISNIFVDVNLREPWWNEKILKSTLKNTKWLKINDEELSDVCNIFSSKAKTEEEQLKFLFEKYNLELIVLTKGSQGALLIDNNMETIELPILKVQKLADTVGAGDAFASVVILGIYKNWDKKLILQRAIEFASNVCQLNGAITDNKEFYTSFLNKWN